MHTYTDQGPPAFPGISIPRERDFRPGGFTLIELLVALTILAAILAMLYPSYTGTFRNIKAAESQSEIYQMARIALERMSEDLQSACVPKGAEIPQDRGGNDRSALFLGQDSTLGGKDADRLRFLSEGHVVLSENDKTGRGWITYYVKEREGEDTLVLYRSDTLELEDKMGEETGGFVLCDHLHSIDFTFQDGKGETYDSWDSSTESFKDRLPDIVTIRLKSVDRSGNGPPIIFMTSVSLPLARNQYVKGP